MQRMVEVLAGRKRALDVDNVELPFPYSLFFSLSSSLFALLLSKERREKEKERGEEKGRREKEK